MTFGDLTLDYTGDSVQVIVRGEPAAEFVEGDIRNLKTMFEQMYLRENITVNLPFMTSLSPWGDWNIFITTPHECQVRREDLPGILDWFEKEGL